MRYLFSSLSLILVVFTASANAQEYPNKQIRLVVQYAVGGGADLIARLLSANLSDILGETIVVDNRPGANGVVANQIVAEEPADGYTLLLSAQGPMVVNQHLYGKGGVDTLADFVPIALVATSKFIVVVNPSLPVHSIEELTAYAKANPGKLNFGSSGNGGSPHLAGELYKMMADVDMVHVPYKGLAPAISDLVSGVVQVIFTDIGLVAGQLQSGDLRAIASTGLERSKLMPELPTLDESGLSGFEAGTWYGVHGPANLPPAIVNKLNSAIRTATARKEVVDRLIAQGLESTQMTPEQFRDYQQASYEKWGKVIKKANIKVD